MRNLYNRRNLIWGKLLAALLVLVLMCAGMASAQTAVRVALPDIQTVAEGSQATLEYNGNIYIFSGEHCRFDAALNYLDHSALAMYDLTVSKDRLASFTEPEDRYLGQVVISAGNDAQLCVLSGDRDTGAYLAAEPVTVNSTYTEYIHASKSADDIFQVVDRIYLLSYVKDGQQYYEAMSLYINYEDYLAAKAEGAETAEIVLAAQTAAPTQVPTEAPTQVPTEVPTEAPTEAPTQAPTEAPTQVPTEAPTQVPTEAPTQAPTEAPTQAPTEAPTQAPTEAPTQVPTEVPTEAPTQAVSLDQMLVEAQQVDVRNPQGGGGILLALVALLALVLVAALAYLLIRKKKGAKGEDTATRSRFFRLSEIDRQMKGRKPASYADDVNLQELCRRFRYFAASRLHLYYSEEMVRCFIASFAASRLIIMQGISGTGKTSLAYAFGKFIGNDSSIIPVQPSWRERSDLLGYFNEFTKRFNETELLEKIYEAQYSDDIYIAVLDEMNIARVEYYFAEFLSVLEMPSYDEWIVSIVPDHWEKDPERLENGRLHLARNMWFVGTANNDDSTFAISDKVYDRAMVLDIDSKAEIFEAPDTPQQHISSTRFMALMEEAARNYRISDGNMEKIQQLDAYIIRHMRVAFGNRIMNQLNKFVPAYMACGGTELGGIDYILCKKVLRKFESQSMALIREEVDDLCEYLDQLFGQGSMPCCQDYLQRLKKMG